MHLVLVVLTTAREIEKAGQRLFRELGLTVAQFNVLNLLADQPAGVRAGTLAEALVVDPSNITGLLRRLGRAGFLAEVAHPADARHRLVALSPKGRALWKKAHAVYQQHLRGIDDRLSGADVSTTLRALRTIASASQDVE